MLRIFPIVFILLIQTSFSFAQTDTTQVIRKHDPSFISKQIVPLGLISSGALLNIGNIKYRIQDKLPTTNSRLDNYFRYVPIAQLYVFDAFGFEHQNTVFDQTKYLLISQLLSGGIVNLLKNVTNVERPSGDNHSFPSDHTSKAFVGATVLYHEFKIPNRCLPGVVICLQRLPELYERQTMHTGYPMCWPVPELQFLQQTWSIISSRYKTFSHLRKTRS